MTTTATHASPASDNIFGAYQLSLDAKDLSYAQLFSVMDTKTARGFVPNFWDAQLVSWDRTEPVIGAKARAPRLACKGAAL